MCVDTHIPSRPTQTLSFTVRNVLLGLGIPILLRHTKVHNVNYCGDAMNRAGVISEVTAALTIRVLGSRATDQEVIRLDIAVDEVLVMDRLHTGQLDTDARAQT